LIEQVVDTQLINQTIIDALSIARLSLPERMPAGAKYCFATVASRGYAQMLNNLLTSLHRTTCIQDMMVVVFNLDSDAECNQIAQKFDACIVSGELLTPTPGKAAKAVMYSIARMIDAQIFVCLDVDTLIISDLKHLFDAIEVCGSNSILVAREALFRQTAIREVTLSHMLPALYRDLPSAFNLFLDSPQSERKYALVINDGVFAGSRQALLKIDSLLRTWSKAHEWVFEWGDTFRNQFVFNLALAHLQCGVELNERYNLQLQFEDVTWTSINGRPIPLWQGESAHILHFNGPEGRRKYDESCRVFLETIPKRGE
jgi:lipopolysaccharide biosynthesis glycosyltransferase